MRRVAVWIARFMVVAVPFVAGLLVARLLDSHEERLARRYVAAERALQSCRKAPRLTASDVAALLRDDGSTTIAICQSEAAELRIAEIALDLAVRRR